MIPFETDDENMAREIRKLRDLGNGSKGVVIPPEHLRRMGLIDDDGELRDETHVFVEQDSDDRVHVEPVQ